MAEVDERNDNELAIGDGTDGASESVATPPDGPSDPSKVVAAYGDYIPAPQTDPEAGAVDNSKEQDPNPMLATAAAPAPGVRDFVPTPGVEAIEDRTFEEKQELARESARLSVARQAANVRDEARRRLDTTSENQVIDFLRDLSPADRNIYLQVERDNRNRSSIFDTFGGPDDSEGSGRPETTVEARTMEEAREAERQGVFGAAVADPETDPTEAKDLPLETISPSDRMHRLAARKADVEGPPDDQGLTNRQSTEEVPVVPEVNRLKAETAAAAVQDAGFEEGSPTVTPDDDQQYVDQAEGKNTEAEETGPGDTEPTEGEIPQEERIEGGEEQPVETLADEDIDTTESPEADSASVESDGEPEAEEVREEPTPPEDALSTSAEEDASPEKDES